jgi:hypothetical protein
MKKIYIEKDNLFLWGKIPLHKLRTYLLLYVWCLIINPYRIMRMTDIVCERLS